MDTHIDRLECQLKDWQLRLAKIDEDMAGTSLKGDRRLLDLKNKHAVAQTALGHYKEAGNDKWDEFKKDIWIAWNDLENAYLDAKPILDEEFGKKGELSDV